MSKRTLAAETMEALGATQLLFALHRHTRAAWLPVLTFHRIMDVPRGYLLDEGVIDATPDELDRRLATIARNFDPIGIDDLVRSLDGAPLPSRPLLVTFDDGYLDNHDVALPMLLRHGIKAVFFIATDYVAHRRVYWWDRIAYLVKTSTVAAIELHYPRPMLLSLASPRDRDHAAHVLMRLVKSEKGLELERFLGELSAAAAVPWTAVLERELAERNVMTWDHVRALHAAGMDIGSHTRTHRVLQTLSPAQIADELVGSRLDLERELGVPVRAISYPVGHTLRDRPDLQQALRDAGYALGFTNATGSQPLPALDRFDIHRIGLDTGMPHALFRATLAAPALFD